MRSNEMARHGKDSNHTKFGQLRQLGQHQIQNEMRLICLFAAVRLKNCFGVFAHLIFIFLPPDSFRVRR